MAFNAKISSVILCLFLLASFGGQPAADALPAMPVTGLSFESYTAALNGLSSLRDFINSVQNGDGTMLVGVYIDGQIALPVVQQPADAAAYVSTSPDVLTQFGAASQFDSTGILAHNYLAGQYFSSLEKGQEVVLVYGDGETQYYAIEEIQSYQALSPTSVYSDFVDLQSPSTRLTSTQLFYKTYGLGNNSLVLQTCINSNGDPSWGRLFIIARPVEKAVEVNYRPSRHIIWDEVVATPLAN